MRTFTMIAASLALLTATACTETEAQIDTASSTAIYLECKTDDDSSAHPVITYRIDPTENTWSWWKEAEEDGDILMWDVSSCAEENRQCTFDDTVFHTGWYAGDRGDGTTINRITGEMQRQTTSEDTGYLFWRYMCTPVGNPADALVRKF